MKKLLAVTVIKGRFLMIIYEPLWITLDLKEVSTYTLIKKHHISSSTINRLRHNKAVSTKTVAKLCEILACYVDDITEFKSYKQS